MSARILVVDDSASMRQMVAFALSSAGFSVDEAEDGQVALGRAQGQKFNAVVTDVNMPNMDGIQALEQIKRLDPDALVVMLTSLANRQTVEECVRLGAADYIRKDTPREELTARFAEIIADCFGDAPEAPPS